MAHGRTKLSRLGTFTLASSAVLAVGAGAGPAAGAPSAGSSHPRNVMRNATPSTLAGIKSRASAEISRRVSSLNSAIAKANAAKGLGASQAPLASYLGADLTPLHLLDQKIQGDASVAQAAQDFSTIFTGFRIYLLVLPASLLAANADWDTATAITQLSADATKAQGDVNAGNQSQLQPLIDDLKSQITTATNATNGVSASVLAYTPSQFNANRALLGAPRASDKTARGALKKARSDVVQIRHILKGEGTTASALKQAGLKVSGLRGRLGSDVSGHGGHKGHTATTTTTRG